MTALEHDDRTTRAVVTGLGVVAPTGIGAEAHWLAVLAGKTGIGRISRFDPTPYPVRLAGEVRDFDARERVPGRLVPQTDHWTHMGLAAAEAAFADAGLDPAGLGEYNTAVVTASSSGGTEFGQREIEELLAGLRPATPDNLPAIGRGALEGLVWATGHHRNGILLTPVTADY